MAYYAPGRAPQLRTGVVSVAQPPGPAYRPGQTVLSSPTWLGAQTGRVPIAPVRLWNRVPWQLVEGNEPDPHWDVTTREL